MMIYCLPRQIQMGNRLVETSADLTICQIGYGHQSARRKVRRF
jgi:hypothetical protein